MTVRTAFVLAAGKGERMQPLTAARAKPALPVLGTPLVARIIAALAAQGVAGFAVNAYHAPDSVRAAVDEALAPGTSARLFVEPELMGSAGALAAPRALLAENPLFLHHNGDTLIDVPLARLAASAAAAPRERFIGTLLVRPGRLPGYGCLTVEDGVVRGRFAAGEEPRGPGEPMTFLGVGLVHRDVLPHVEAGRPTQFFPDLVLPLLDAGWTLAAERYDGEWIEFTSPRQYLANVVRLVLSGATSGQAPLPGPVAPVTMRTGGALFVAKGGALAPNAVIEGGVAVERGARVGAGAALRNALVLEDATIERGARLENVVVDRNVTVPEGTSWQDGVLVKGADGTHVFRRFAD